MTAADRESEMIKRVARAIAFSNGSGMVGDGQNLASREVGWSGDGKYLVRYVELHWEEHIRAAGFAIAAMHKQTAGDREAPAQAMMRLGLATGHGDTIHDLITELIWQVEELRDRIFGLQALQEDKP